jgi:hypothetical protein
MRAVLSLMLVCAWGGCPHPTPSPAPSPTPPLSALPSCDFSVHPQQSGVCDGVYTRDPSGVDGGTLSYACVVCQGAQGCVTPQEQVYCVVGSCLADPLCQPPKGVRQKKLKGDR